MPTESGIILPTDGTGKATRTNTLTTTFTTGSGGVVHQPVMAIGDPNTAARLAAVDVNGRLLVAQSGGSPQAASAPVSVTATSVVYTTACDLAGNATIHIYPSSATATTAGNVVVFEGSNDNSNWFPLTVQQISTGLSGTTFTLPAMSQFSSQAFNAGLTAFNYLRVRTTTFAGAAFTIATLLGGGQFMPTPTISGPIRDFKDTGRTTFATWFTAAAGITTEALTTMLIQRAGVAGTSGTSIPVTTGKTFRIQNITASMRLGAAAAGYTRFMLRYAVGAAVTATSQALWEIEFGPAGAAVGSADAKPADFPDGLELPSNSQFGITRLSSATTNVESLSITGYEY